MEFDLSTLKGLQKAEKYQNKLYSLYNKVAVDEIEFNKIKIRGV